MDRHKAGGAPETIVNISISDASGKGEAQMSSDEQCRTLMRIAASDIDGYAYMFKNAVGTIIDTVDGHLQSAKQSGRSVSKDQMARYEAEFDTWFSYTTDVLMSCRNVWIERMRDVADLARHCVSSEWDHAVERIMETLVKMYKNGAWAGFVTDFFEYGMPEGYGADPFDDLSSKGSRYVPIDTHDRINLYIDVLEGAGSDPGRIYRMYWMDDGRTCVRYLRHLLEKGGGHMARRVASIGPDLFPGSGELAAEALNAIDSADEGAELKARCGAYAAGLGPEYYEMARESPRWNAEWARRLAGMLAANKEHDAEMRVLVEAGMHEEALDVLQYDGTMKMAILHRRTLAASRPDRYYEACKALVAGAPKTGKSKAHYAMMRQCLRAMKAVPGRESDFNEMCHSMLQEGHPGSSEFRRLIKEVAG